MFFRHNISAGVVLWVALAFWAWLVFVPPSYSREVQLGEFLSRTVRLSQDDLQALKAGEAVTMEFPCSPQNELFLFGAVRVDAPVCSYLTGDRNALFFDPHMVQASGDFHLSPREEDIKDLAWPAEDLEDLPQCRPGSCKIKLPPGYIEQLAPFSGNGSAFQDHANPVLRRTLIDYLNSYRRLGNATLMEYRDKPQAVSLADEFNGILENFAPFNRYIPALHTYLKNFPQNRPPDTKDRFIWAKVLLGGKARRPTIFLYHLVTYRLPEGNGTVIALKQLYASHYYEAALGLTLILTDAENPSRFYLLHFDRGRIDVLRQIPEFLSSSLRGETRRLLARRLEAIQQEAKKE
ncbi:MAG: hypothetical protein P8175_19260 [Deltaproteobacteria bacterium]|jgi:hypothetical protein